MYQQLKEHLFEFTTVTIVFGGIFYTATTTYKTSLEVQQLSEKLKEDKEEIKKIKIALIKQITKDTEISPEVLHDLIAKESNNTE